MKPMLPVALALPAALVTNALPAHAADADPYQIFGHARSVWAQQRYPTYLTYTVTVHVTERGVDKARHYHLAYDAQQTKIYVNPVSDEERVAPPDPNGVTFHLLPKRQHQTLFDKKIGNPGEAVDYLGVPMISPTYSFGMSATGGAEGAGDQDPNALVQEIRREYSDPTPPAKAQELAKNAPMKTIAMVTGYQRSYVVTLAGMENLEGRDCYHLLLKPTNNSPNLRLRELWVDTQTYETHKLVTSGNFTGSRVPWTITFANQNGAMYIVDEEAMQSVGFGDHRYDHASVSFDAITPVDRPPSSMSGWFVTKDKLMVEPDTPGPN